MQTPNVDATYQYQQTSKNLFTRKIKPQMKTVRKNSVFTIRLAHLFPKNAFFRKFIYYFTKHRSMRARFSFSFTNNVLFFRSFFLLKIKMNLLLKSHCIHQLRKT